MKSTILVVDDTAESLAVITSTLASEDYNVRPADSGELALASALSDPPDLVLLDIRMPGMDGFEVCRRLKADPSTRAVPIIFISASTEIEERVQGLELGAVDYISKPFHSAELLVRVRIHLELSGLRAHLEQMVSERTAEVMVATELLRKNTEFQRTFLSDALACVTDGVLILCQDAADLPPPLSPFGDPIVLSVDGSLMDLRDRTRRAALSAGIVDPRASDLVTAVNEAGMNAIVHVGAGVATVAIEQDLGQDPGHAPTGRVQVRVQDRGAGITLERLPRATLLKGYTTAGTLGFGMKMMLSLVDRVYLLTGSGGTTVVLEQSRDSNFANEFRARLLTGSMDTHALPS